MFIEQLKSAKGNVIMTVDFKKFCSLKELLFLLPVPLTEGPVMMRLVSSSETLTELESTNRVRSEFTETWLWAIVKIG